MSDPIHVCFVSLQARGAFFPGEGKKIGGAENQVRHLATWLAAHGFRVSVIVEDIGQPKLETAGGVELRRIDQPAGNSGLARLKRRIISGIDLWRTAKKLNADVYIQRTAGVETGIAAHAARALNKKFIFIASSDSETAAPYRDSMAMMPILFRWGIRRADRVIAQHEAQREAFETAYGRPAIVLPDVYPFGEPEYSTGERVIWVGRCVSVKQPRMLLELARRLPELKFAMVTSVSEHEPGLIDEIAREAAAVGNVEFIPNLPWPRLQEVYRSGAVLINTSIYEGIPNTFFEAAAHGLAIASLNVDPGGMLSREGAGVCAGGDFERLAQLVRGIIEDKPLRRQLADRAQNLLRERHDIETVGKRMAEMIRELSQ